MANEAQTRFSALFRDYDKAVVRWVRSVLRYNNRPLMCVFATPERAFAQAERILTERGGSLPNRSPDQPPAGRTDDRKPVVIPVPISSVDLTSYALDRSRYVEYTHRRVYYLPETKRYVNVKRPLPMNLTYNISIWARLLEDLDDFLGQLYMQTRISEFYLPVTHKYPIGDKIVLSFLLDPKDDPKVHEVGKNRLLRRVFPIKICGWLCYDPYEISRIEKVTTRVYDTEAVPANLLQTVVEVGEE